VIAATTMVVTVLGSLILDWSRNNSVESYGYMSLLLMAVAGALLGWYSMNRMPDVKLITESTNFHKVDFLSPVRDKNFRNVLIVFAFWNVAVGLSAAFFAPHMLLNLKMSFFQIGLYSCATALVAVASSRVWGRYIDRFGSKPILNICAFGISLVPLIWIFPDQHSTWILIPEAIYSGLLWAGFNLAAFTLPLDRSPQVNRTVYLAMFAAVTGLSFFLASIAAGYFAEILSDWSWVSGGIILINYHMLFIASAIVRQVTAGIIASFHEPNEIRLPVVIQLMGYAVLKRISLGRQVFPYVADVILSDDNNRKQ
jgi:MFS family permease